MPEYVYFLKTVGHEGMYCYGGLAVSPELAKLNVSNLIRTQDRDKGQRLLGIIRRKAGLTGHCKDVLFEVEKYPGEWTIGVPGTQRYSPGVHPTIGALDDASRRGDEVAQMALNDAVEEGLSL